ncbi:MAG: hypothetical protein BZY82_09175 [SAR202 cluster bacterium Io17-Chloro-G3]|nr:MAG: hypothetical protein BZY82_09175 [SAR202 cluster bacterium Io17-Chloro-G3]
MAKFSNAQKFPLLAQTLSMDRRAFLLRAGAMGLSLVAFEALLAACNTPNASITATPIGSNTAPAAPQATTTPTPVLAPTATPNPIPQPTTTPTQVTQPISTPTSIPQPTTTPTHVPSPTPTPIAILQPSPILSSERVRIGHLLRRAGFGARQEDYDKFLAMGLDATVDYLLDYDSVDNSALESRLASLDLDMEKGSQLKQWWLIRMIYTERPLQEKMVLFWHGILTSSYKKGGSLFMHVQNELFRKHALDNYDVLLKAVSRDPAMLNWLDSKRNKKRAPNENYSRELMELFTMGIGHYTEEDVRESARAFTGWGLLKGEFRFNPKDHDNLSKRFLGKTGDFHGDDIVDIILEHPATGDFIARELFSFFAYDDPEPEIIQSLAATFQTSKYSMKAVMRQILTSPAFYSEKAYRAKIKSPSELVAGTVRSLGIETDGKPLSRWTEIMGQVLFAPPDVSGWDGGETWINSTTLLQRLNFVNLISANSNKRLPFDPVKLLPQDSPSLTEAGLEYFPKLLLDENMAPEEQQVLQAYLTTLDARVGSLMNNEKLKSLIYLVMASPEFQLA